MTVTGPALTRAKVILVPSASRGHERFAAAVITTTRLAAVWSVVALLGRRVRWAHRVNDLFGVLNLPVAPSLFTVVLLVVLETPLCRRDGKGIRAQPQFPQRGRRRHS